MLPSFLPWMSLGALLQLPRFQRIALRNIAGLKSLRKPANPLVTRAVREALGYDHTFSLALQCIVADLCGGIQGFFNILLFQPSLRLLRMMRPDPGKAVGL